jgi:hypothetical protein
MATVTNSIPSGTPAARRPPEGVRSPPGWVISPVLFAWFTGSLVRLVLPDTRPKQTRW